MTIQERRASQKRRRRAAFGLRRLADIAASAFRHVFAESVGALLPRTAYAGAAARITACNYTPGGVRCNGSTARSGWAACMFCAWDTRKPLAVRAGPAGPRVREEHHRIMG